MTAKPEITGFTRLEAEVAASVIGSTLHETCNGVRHVLNQLKASGLFLEYTGHDIEHSREMLRICEWLIPEYVTLNEVEKYVLVVSAYLHDVGMVVTKDEKSAMLDTASALWSEKGFHDLRAKYPEAPVEKALEDFIRANHHVRSYDYVLREGKALGLNTELIPVIATVCQSHGLADLDHEMYKTGYPIRSEEGTVEVNIQYLAILIRLADILDITKYRAPDILHRMINPKNPRSSLEWNKHLAVSGIVRSSSTKQIALGATVYDPDVYASLVEYAAQVEREVQYCRSILRTYDHALSQRYFLELETIALDQVITIGFVPKPLRISVSNSRVLELFMGKELYQDSQEAALRELLANAVDSCRVRASIQAPAVYKPSIEVLLNTDDQTLTVKDNGIGMDLFTIENYLLRVGESYYSSERFRLLGCPHSSIGRFGIGFMSCFAVARTVDVYTRYFTEDTSTHVELRGLDEHAILWTKEKNIAKGTKIVLHLTQGFSSIGNLVKKWLPHVEIPVMVKEGTTVQTVVSRGFETILDIEHIGNGKRDEFSKLDYSFESPGVRGIVSLLLTNGKINDTSYVMVRRKELTRSTSFRGIYVDDDLPLPGYWNTRCFLYDIDITDQNAGLLLNREGFLRNDQWDRICGYVESVILDRLEEFAGERGLLAGKAAADFVGSLVHFRGFESRPASQPMMNFLNNRLKWWRVYGKNGKTRWVSPSEVLECFDVIGTDCDRRIWGDDEEETEIVHARFLSHKHKIDGVVEIPMLTEVSSYLSQLANPECVVVSSSGYSALRYSKHATKPRTLDNDILIVPFHRDGRRTDRIFSTVVGQFVVINEDHPLTKLLLFPRGERFNSWVNTVLLRLFDSSDFIRKGFFSMVNGSLRELCSEFSLDLIQLSRKDFPEHDFWSYWLSM